LKKQRNNIDEHIKKTLKGLDQQCLNQFKEIDILSSEIKMRVIDEVTLKKFPYKNISRKTMIDVNW